MSSSDPHASDKVPGMVQVFSKPVVVYDDPESGKSVCDECASTYPHAVARTFPDYEIFQCPDCGHSILKSWGGAAKNWRPPEPLIVRSREW